MLRYLSELTSSHILLTPEMNASPDPPQAVDKTYGNPVDSLTRSRPDTRFLLHSGLRVDGTDPTVGGLYGPPSFQDIW